MVGQIDPTSISDGADTMSPVAMVQLCIHVSHLYILAEVCRQMRVLLVWRG